MDFCAQLNDELVCLMSALKLNLTLYRRFLQEIRSQI